MLVGDKKEIAISKGMTIRMGFKLSEILEREIMHIIRVNHITFMWSLEDMPSIDL